MPVRVHMTLGWLLVLVTLALVGFWIPPATTGEPVKGTYDIAESYLIFFFHFPSALNCLNLFLIAGGISIAYLAKPTTGRDLAAASAVEVGLLATTVTLVTGSIWARAAWQVWWDFTDLRLMSVAVMWLTYLGYTALRGTLEEPTKRARFCAVFGVIASVNVPIVYFSIRVLGVERHPMNIELGETSMIVTRWLGAAAFLVLYTAFWRVRYEVLQSTDRVRRLEASLSRVGA